MHTTWQKHLEKKNRKSGKNANYNSKIGEKFMNKKILLWIAVPVTTLVIVVTVLMLTRKENNKNNEVGNISDQTQTNEVEQNKENLGNEDEEEKEWGITDRFTARNDQGQESCYINLPQATGHSEGYARFTTHANRTALFYAGQNPKCPEISSISEMFPAYFETIEYALKAYYGFMSENYEFSLNSNKAVTVGDYDMHTFEGEFEFDNDDEHCKYQFVAYATTLKSNGAYAYWVVYDTSEDQSNGELIKEYAYKMARTFREEE